MKRKVWISMLALVAVGGGAFFFLRSRRQAAAGTPDGAGREGRVVPVLTQPAERRDVPIYLEGLGNVLALRTATVKSQVDGRLERVQFTEGQAVKRGDLLAQVDPRPFSIQLHQAQGSLARDTALLHDNQVNLDRYRSLREQKLVAQQQVDDQGAQVGQYQGAVQVDQAQIETAKLNLEWARITSPIDGVTGVRQVDPGNLVHPSDAGGIVVVTQLDPIALMFTLPEDDLPTVSRELADGRTLTVEAYSRDGSSKLGEGKLLLIDNQINASTATIRLKAQLDNPKHMLWPNQFVKAKLLVTTRKQALVVPLAAVARGPQGAYVYVVSPEGTALQKPIELAEVAGDLQIVAKGIAPGDQVVVDGGNQLKPGARVSVRPAEKKPR